MKISAGTALKRMTPTSDAVFHLDQQQLLALQSCTLDVLEALIDTCDKHSLRYVLGGGTALGAARHRGFIPWDDDADFNMPRADADELVRVLRAQRADEFDVLAPKLTHDYGLPFIQVRKRGTVAVKQEDFCTASLGVCVDIFPIENMYDNPVQRAAHGAACLAMGFILSCRRVSEHQEQFLGLAAGNNALQATFARKASIGHLLGSASLDRWCEWTDAIYSLCQNEQSALVGIPSGRKHFFGELYPRETFFPAAFGEFEGHVWKIPGDCEGYLGRLYGDWRAMPEEDEREHHWYVQLELPGLL